MAEIVLIMGGSGTGKTTSIRSLDPQKTYLLSIVGKSLPFLNWKSMYKVTTKEQLGNRKIIYDSMNVVSEYRTNPKLFKEITSKITNTISAAGNSKKFDTIIIDDSQYCMAYEYMGKANDKGFDKFNEMAQNFFTVLQTAQALPENIIVFFLHHTEIENNIKKAKTLGRMIDNVVTLEGLFTIVLETDVSKINGKMEYSFITNNEGNSTAKSPEGMFPIRIPNDLQLVKNYITKYNGE